MSDVYVCASIHVCMYRDLAHCACLRVCVYCAVSGLLASVYDCGDYHHAAV